MAEQKDDFNTTEEKAREQVRQLEKIVANE